MPEEFLPLSTKMYELNKEGIENTNNLEKVESFYDFYESVKPFENLGLNLSQRKNLLLDNYFKFMSNFDDFNQEQIVDEFILSSVLPQLRLSGDGVADS